MSILNQFLCILYFQLVVRTLQTNGRTDERKKRRGARDNLPPTLPCR